MIINKVALVTKLDEAYETFKNSEVNGDAAAHAYHIAIADAVDDALANTRPQITGVQPGTGTIVGTLILLP
jgi:hypothetical protein